MTLRNLLAVGVLWFGVSSTVACADDRQAVIDRGIDYLLVRGRAEDGSFSKESGPGVTALVLSAVLKNRPDLIDDVRVRQSLDYLTSFVQPDGGIYTADGRFQNYETCLAINALVAANRDARYADMLKNAEQFVRGIQWDDNEGVESSDPSYGGSGYGREVRQRPDLSNTTFLIGALQGLGRGPDDEAIQRALVFVSRCQNLDSQHNQTAFAGKVNDGGFYYTPAAGGNSQAGLTSTGGLRSYGSMTYAGLMSMIFAGLAADDPRVQAALEFIRDNYTLEQNPGMGDAGLYYYYHTFAKALSAAGVDRINDAKGEPRDWRTELVDVLAAAQQPDGSWVNNNSRWLEGDRNLVTAYALLALHYSAAAH
jgi:squalene-hopene/tetraprenyl-beta-curcumene cyclase